MSTSRNHGLIVQSVRASEQNSVVLGLNPTQANSLYLLQRILQWYHIYIPYISVQSTAPMIDIIEIC